MSEWRWLKGQGMCLAVVACLLGENVHFPGCHNMNVLSCVYPMAKAMDGNAVHGGFAGCFCKFRSCFSCLSDTHRYRDPLQRSLCIAALKWFLYPDLHSCHVLPPGVRLFFSEKLRVVSLQGWLHTPIFKPVRLANLPLPLSPEQGEHSFLCGSCRQLLNPWNVSHLQCVTSMLSAEEEAHVGCEPF